MIAILITVGILRDTPEIKIKLERTFSSIRVSRLLTGYDTSHSSTNALIRALLQKKLPIGSAERPTFIVIDPQYSKPQRSRASVVLDHNQIVANAIDARKEQLGYIPRRQMFARGSSVLNPTQDVSTWLSRHYFKVPFAEPNSVWSQITITNDILYEVIESLQNPEDKLRAYQSLTDARNTFTIFSVSNAGRIDARNIDIYVDFTEFPGANVFEHVKEDGIHIVDSGFQHSHLRIPLLHASSIRYIVLCTGHYGFVPKSAISTTHDTWESINWSLSRRLLFLGAILCFVLVCIDRRYFDEQ